MSMTQRTQNARVHGNLVATRDSSNEPLLVGKVLQQRLDARGDSMRALIQECV